MPQQMPTACMLLLAAVLALATSAPKDAQTPMR